MLGFLTRSIAKTVSRRKELQLLR